MSVITFVLNLVAATTTLVLSVRLVRTAIEALLEGQLSQNLVRISGIWWSTSSGCTVAILLQGATAVILLASMRLAGNDARGRQAQCSKSTLQPGREHPAPMHDPVRRKRPGTIPTGHAFGIGGASAVGDGLAILVHDTDRNFFRRYVQSGIMFHRSFSSRLLSMRPTYRTSFAPGERPPQAHHVVTASDRNGWVLA